MSISKSLLEGISQVVRCPIQFICQISYNTEPFFLCIGRHSIFLVKQNLESIMAEIYLAHIQKVILNINNNKQFAIHFNENRENDIPAKMNITTEDRSLFINSLKCAWKTDYMFRIGSIKNLPILKAELEINNNIKSQQQYFLLNLFKDEPLERFGFIKYEISSYVFYIPKNFKQKLEGIFVEEDFQAKISIQITNQMQIQQMQLLQDREDLQYYAQMFQDEIVKNLDNQYWIVSSSVYLKRANFNMDLALWQGWNIVLKDQARDICIILLRRKYIPPVMDTFQDISFVIYGPNKDNYQKIASQFKQHKKGIFKEYTSYVEILKNVADYFCSSSQLNQAKYELMMKEQANALLLDEQSYFFFQTKFEIKPKAIKFAIQYIKAILDILKINDNKFDELIKLLHTKFGKDLENILTLQATPQQIITQIKSENQSNNLKQQKIWEQKVSRYFAYCINGGLLYGQFTIQTLIEAYKNMHDKENKEAIQRVIDFLLHLTCEDEQYAFLEIGKRIQKIQMGEIYSFNENVMRILLEHDYFGFEIQSSDLKPIIFSKFILYLLTYAQSSSLKKTLCRYIIDQQAISKSQSGQESEYMKESFMNLIPKLIEFYESQNNTLAILACIALINLCSNQQDIKIFIISKNGINAAFKYISSRNENLLLYSLQLISSLCSVYFQFIYQLLKYRYQGIEEIINFNLIQQLMQIIEGTGIQGTDFNDKIYCQTIQLMRLLIYSTDQLYYQLSELNFIVRLNKMITVQNQDQLDAMLPNSQRYSELVQLLLKLIGKMDFKSESKKIFENLLKICQYSINPKNIKKKGIQTILEKNLHFFFTFLKENIKNLDEESEILDLVQNIVKDDTIPENIKNAAFLIQDLYNQNK